MSLTRTPFKRKPPAAYARVERIAPVYARLTVPVRYPVFEAVAPLPKEDAVRSEEYRRLVATMPCKVCGIQGYSQAAHPNTGKGAGLKTDDRLCFALCSDRPGVQGCHPKFDQGAMFTKAVRQELEPAWAADTQRYINALGMWPKGLPQIENTLETQD